MPGEVITAELNSTREFQFPERDQKINRAMEEYWSAAESGQPLNIERLLRRHPELADDLKSLLFHGANSTIGLSQSRAHIDPSEDDARGLRESANRYALKNIHASGGIGRVWLARDNELGRNVAVKELRPERSIDSGTIQRFLQEARITAELEHPGIIPVYEIARWPGSNRPFYAMRMVHGRTLSQAAIEFHASLREMRDLIALLNAFVVVCKAIAYAHSKGVIHRDLKGQNVMLGEFGEVVVLDWGLAKRAGEIGIDSESCTSMGVESNSPMMTNPGIVVGTPSFMSPEQANGSIFLDARTDVYGLGAVLYQVLTGTGPFSGHDAKDVIHKVLHDDPIPPRQIWSAVPETLEAICLRAISKHPQNRFESASELADSVENWMTDLLEQRRTEQERARFFSLSVDLLCIADSSGYFRQLNGAWERTLGWSPEEFTSRPWIEFVHPDDRDRTIAEAARVLNTGDPLLTWENRYRCKNGRFKWLSWTASLIDGEDAIYATARDVTSVKQSRRNQELIGSLLSKVLCAMSGTKAFLILDEDGSVIMDYGGQVAELSASQLAGLSPLPTACRIFDEMHRSLTAVSLKQMLIEDVGESARRISVESADGEIIWVSVTAYTVQCDDLNAILVAFSAG